MSRLVVLGADGFIGRNLINRLSTDNAQDTIVAFDRFNSSELDNKHPFDELSNVTRVAGDFFNRHEVSSVIEAADYVFHLVSTTNPATSNDDPLFDVDTNIHGSIELFELCVKHNVKKVIFLSSGGTVYGDIDSPSIDELTLPQPRSPYGIGKLTIEHFLRYFRLTAGLDYIVYRVANPYGPGQDVHGKQGVIPIFMNKYASGEPITIYGDGGMIRDYLYIDDLVEMISGSFAENNKFSEYNIGSGSGKSLTEIVQAIEACTGIVVEKKHIDVPSTYIEKSVLDTTRYKAEFGLSPSTTLQEGIKRTWSYVKSIK